MDVQQQTENQEIRLILRKIDRFKVEATTGKLDCGTPIFYILLFRKDFDKFSQVDTHAADLFKDILKRARARPDKLPVFQDITTERSTFVKLK